MGKKKAYCLLIIVLPVFLFTGAILKNNETMIKVEGGEFVMGDNSLYCSIPEHKVTLKDFYISKYETTVGEFEEFIKATEYKTDAEKSGYVMYWTGSSLQKEDNINWRFGPDLNKRSDIEKDHPVLYVSWNDAVEYCNWKSKQEGKNFRLPTEAEWEFCARGGKEGIKNKNIYSGSNNVDEVACYKLNSDQKTYMVGTKKGNELGLYDMSGNAAELCADDWYDYQDTHQVNPNVKNGSNSRVMRGGAWMYLEFPCRVGWRNQYPAKFASNTAGFRIAMD